MSRAILASAIAAEKDNLIARWRRRVQGSIDPSSAPREELLDSLPDLLDEMVAQLRSAPEDPSDEMIARTRAIGVAHGTERFRIGFSLGSVIREFGALRDCLFELIRERQLPIDFGQLAIISTVLTAGVVSAAEQYARDRDDAIARQNREHFGFIAHELRNPLGSALLASQVLQRRPGAAEDVTLQRLARNLGVLSQLVDSSLVSVHARDAGTHRALDLTDLSLGAIVENARSEMGPDIEAKQLTIAVEGDARIRADPRLVRSALTNLMRNAVKYTRPGGRIAVRVQADNRLASVEVEDQCGGLPPGKTEELFTPFVQRGDDRTGFGLGLAIAKDAVEAHQGTIQVSNLPGKGCVFMVSFPLAGPVAPEG